MTGPEQSSWRILTFSKRSNETISVPTKWLLLVGSQITTKFQTTPINQSSFYFKNPIQLAPNE